MKQFANKNTGLLNSLELKELRYIIIYWTMFCVLALMALINLLPAIWVMISSFKSSEELYRVPPTLWPERFIFENIANAWNKAQLGRGFINSFCIVIGCLMFDITLNGIFGYTLSRIKPTGTRILDTLIFWSMLLPGISMVPLYITFVNVPVLQINLSGSFLPLWMMAGCNAFNVLMFRSFFNGIPMSYVDAARIDGCSDLGIFARIILPLSKPIVIVLSIFSVIGSWSSFMWPYLLLGSTPLEPVSVKLYAASVGVGNLLPNEVMMITMISVIPMLVIYIIFSKHIMAGLSIGGLKG